ncbi:MAG: HAD family hydrolase [Candidatus Dojkabacteria bacterium]
MKIKAALMDLDDTICDSEHLYKEALDVCHTVFNRETGQRLTYLQFEKLYKSAKEATHALIPSSAARHNRAIYFQQLVETLDIHTDFDLIFKLYDAYYNYVYKNMKLYPYALELIQWLKETDRKIIIVSDGNTHVRINKINALGISRYVDYLVSSEEVGIEKPSAQPFLVALNKARLHPEEVVMLGNKAKNDIYGANRVGIITIHVNINNSPDDQPERDEHRPRYKVNKLEKVVDIIKYLELN